MVAVGLPGIFLYRRRNTAVRIYSVRCVWLLVRFDVHTLLWAPGNAVRSNRSDPNGRLGRIPTRGTFAFIGAAEFTIGAFSLMAKLPRSS
jgi:hypothetical protein